RLMHARVTGQRIGEDAAIWWMSILIGGQFRLGRERELAQRFDRGENASGLCELSCIEPVVGENLAQQTAEPLLLVLDQRRPVPKLLSGAHLLRYPRNRRLARFMRPAETTSCHECRSKTAIPGHADRVCHWRLPGASRSCRW